MNDSRCSTYSSRTQKQQLLTILEEKVAASAKTHHHTETLSVATVSTRYNTCYAPTKIIHALYRPSVPTVVSVQSFMPFTPTLSLSPNIHAVPAIITSIANIHVISATVITFTYIHVVPAIDPLLRMHNSCSAVVLLPINFQLIIFKFSLPLSL